MSRVSGPVSVQVAVQVSPTLVAARSRPLQPLLVSRLVGSVS